MKALLYCCKNKPYINKRGDDITDYPDYVFDCEGINGKIAAECDYEVEKIKFNHIHERDDLGRLHNEWWWEYRGLNIGNYQCKLAKESCLDSDAIMDYLGNKDGYAINIKNLDIWNTPRSLERMGVKRPIKNITKALALRIAGFTLERYIIIPVKSELMCKVLNGECTTIVKKKILKEML